MANEKHKIKVEPHPTTFTDAVNPKKSTFKELFDTPLKTAERIQELESQLTDANATIRQLRGEIEGLKQSLQTHLNNNH